MNILIIVAIIVVVAIALTILIVKSMWRVAEPNEALIISGGRGPGGIGQEEDVPYKIVVGKGALVIPGLQTVRMLSLNARKADLEVTTVTSQGIPVKVRGVVIYKVGNTLREIANAASRFLGENLATMADTVDELFAGHMRSILGGLTMEEINNDRARLSSETRASSAEEMETLGLKIDSLQIQEIDDPSGYIASIAAPHQAAVERDAKIAQAAAMQAATEKQQAAASAAARAVSESEIAQSEVRAESDKARELAGQAGPLAQAQAQKEVVVQQTEVARLEADRRQMELEAETVRPAQAARDARIAAAEAKKREVELDAEADATQTTTIATAKATARKLEADADAAAKTVVGEAEASAIEAKLTAQAVGIEKRAAALATNNEAVIAQTLAENAPDLVRAASESFRGIDQLIVLNGAEGLTGIAGEAMKLGFSVMPTIQQLLGKDNGHKGNGATPQSDREPERDDELQQEQKLQHERIG